MAGREDTQSLLELHGEDYTLFVYSATAGAMQNKAARLYEVQPVVYAWSEKDTLYVGEQASEPLQWSADGCKAPAVFFENTEYIIELEFESKVKSARLVKPYEKNEGSAENKLGERFHFSRNRFSGSLNFGNDIGKFELDIAYETDTTHHVRLFGDVLSTKLDYHSDLKHIVEEIEREYRMLSFDFLKKTYHGFTENPNGTTSDLMWWNVFAGIQEEFVRNAAFIIDRPHNRLRPQTEYVRADKLKRLTPQQENELAEYRNIDNHLYRNETWQLNDDTLENRFLKFAVNDIADKYQSIAQSVKNQIGSNIDYCAQIQDTEDTLTRLRHAPFFRRIGTFKGLQGENLVLKQAAGYSTIYRDWLLLQMAYDLYDGAHRMELKNIAELYEIWCFIQVKNIVRDLLGEDTEEETKGNAVYGNFIYELARGGSSAILLRKQGVELAEVLYNSQLDETNKKKTGMEDAISLTVPQRPDIILRLTKPDVNTGLKLTYLFDAKYRMDKKKGMDIPPDDTINQMHRYRDAIYYSLPAAERRLSKEVLGGYILYPGDESVGNYKLTDFYKSIEQVNIGAFPLRPGSSDEAQKTGQLLREFIANLITQDKETILQDVIPQKGTTIELHDRVLIGLVKNEKALFDKNLYYTGSKFPTTISLDGLSWFMPYFKGKGIRDIYKIKRIRTITAGEAKDLDSTDSASNDIRLAFELEAPRQFYEDFVLDDRTSLSIDYTFKDTNLQSLRTKTK